MRFHTVLFDLDGTLTDPGLGITNSVMYALRNSGIEVGERNEYYKYIGPPLLDSFQLYEHVSAEEARDLLRLFRVYFTQNGIYENTLYPGIPQMLSALYDAGIRIGLATSKPEEFAIRILEHFDIRRYFHFVSGSTMDETRSQKTEIIEYALRLGDLQSGDRGCAMVGDRSYDIFGAKEYGLTSVGVTFGYGSRQEITDCKPDHIADSAADLLKILVK